MYVLFGENFNQKIPVVGNNSLFAGLVVHVPVGSSGPMCAHLAEAGEAQVDALALGEGVARVGGDAGLPVPLTDRGASFRFLLVNYHKKILS